ncbi:mediator complex subunit 13 C-terminal-domain-containing protein [Mucor lusitanicus]|uniref:Mediator of RNA polymerase II transcription subunit 13 n=1 Tax=Mucor circinelloides f. lusitanicus TaxID=29924 RepID=A0A8H4BRD5_MUCCL|nr:mediator complex subunit 13 C-terminal-domain-containing protein [Mucor lusitanicus]
MDPPESHNALIDAYRHILALNIPATWHILSNQKTDKDTVTLELWIFWFDNKHTQVIETDARLKELHESKSGSFNWNQITSKNGLSPTSSPQLSQSKAESITLVPGIDYKLFIKSIRHLIQHVMIHKRHALALGEFFVFPETYQDDGNVMKDEMANYDPMSVKNTMLACMYNVYFTTSNLVFQPNTRRMRLRPLCTADVYSTHMKGQLVLLCPTGEHARIVSFHSLPTDMQSKVLDQWAEFYDMPVSLLTQKKDLMPLLITLRTASQDTVVYPSALVFVPTDTKQSPAAVAGMNGIMGLNHGLTEDLGAKASRAAYYERLLLNNTQAKDATVDYWSYRNPIIHVGNAVFEALSTVDAKYQQDQLMLHRALIEPIVGSPIMNAKSVVPTNYDSPLLMPGLHRKSTTPPTASFAQQECSMQLAEYATSRFDDTPADDLMLGLLQDTVATSTDSLDIGGGSHLSALLTRALIIDSTDHLSLPASDNTTAQQPSAPLQIQSALPQPQANALPIKDESHVSQPPLEDFDLMYDLGGASLHKADAWDADDGFGDLDLDVTDADFDFFETPAVVAAAAATAPPPPVPASEPNVLHIIPMDIDSPKADLVQAQEQPEPIDQEMVDVQVSELKPTPNNNDSLFTPFVVSHDSTENTSTTAATVDEASYTATPSIMQETSTLQKRFAYQKSTPEPSSFVPRDFLPVPVETSVNDAKYSAGGKFMYDPSKDQAKTDSKGFDLSKKALFYSPDYVPTRPKKKLNKSKQQALKENKDDLSLDTQAKATWSDHDKEESSSGSNSDSSSSGSSGSDSGNSSGSSDSFTTDDSQDSDTESESDIDKMDDSTGHEGLIEKRFRALKRFQKSVVYSQLKATPAPVPTDRLQSLDYDTPFAPILAHGSIKPIKWRHSKAMEESLAYLCEQAVLGGYPLAGGLAEVSENGGEIDGEPAKVLMARRNNLMQMTRGVVTHVPSLQADIDIKGPLSIQEYYDLNESHNHGHSKYGKYQIKKRRPDEPNLDVIKRPDIVVSRHEDNLKGSSTMIPFWEKLGLDPYSAKKQIKYLVVYPNNSDIEASVRHFFKGLGNVYEACHLGRHEPGYAGPFTNGLVPVSVADLDNNDSSVRQRLKSYEETCETVGRHLAMDEEQQKQQHFAQSCYTVVYIVNPGPHMSSYLDMCRCFHKLKEAYARIAHKNFIDQQPRIALQLMPIDHLLRPSAFGGYTMLGMKDIAFSVYSKCFARVTRKVSMPNQASWADIYAPAFVLTRPLQRTIKFKLNDIRPFPTIMEQNAVLHMAYCFSYDRAWMSVVWVDDRGELLEYDLFSRKTAFKEAWQRTLEIAKRTAFPWTIVITKLGLMFNDELLYWLRYVSAAIEHHVTIVAMDVESGLNLHFNACYPNRDRAVLQQQHDAHQPSFLDAHGKTVAGGMHYAREQQQQQQSKRHRSNSTASTAVSEAQILLLNHRVSYSQKRERAYKGILRPEAITEKENWMIPLATGYLIHHSLPNKNVNPCMEQFNNEAFVAEIHLLYNQTDVSAYSTLQDIIKRLYALSFINPIPSSHTCMPYHVVVAERLSRVLLVIDDSIK